MGYQISFDGALSADLAHLLRSVESQINGQGLHVQAQTTGTTETTGMRATTNPPCPKGQVCPDNPKGGHDAVIIGVTAVIAFILGYAVGTKSSS